MMATCSGVRFRIFLAGLVLAFLVLLLPSCRLEYGSAVEAESLEQSIPDYVLTDTVFEIYRDSKLAMVITSGKASVYARIGKRDFENVGFSQFNSRGELSVMGKSDSAVYMIQEEKTEFKGNLEVHLLSENARIKTDYLFWDKKEGLLKGKPEVKVSVEKDDGTSFSGYDLRVDVNSRSMALGGGVSGVVVNPEE